ncbi:fungal-specific transcription factor domain-containing protein [Lineolata rhizophorae]|uniref:Fungal-specific transcription factor domain-containing protein n=1 Tax=Lineolata rhizophorae TaxID=578093 RepID=A0A6A6NUB5_9PEZI|nr:fungal-specific transcription factor domain-containing protein [Lineolata rhizophorae]
MSAQILSMHPAHAPDFGKAREALTPLRSADGPAMAGASAAAAAAAASSIGGHPAPSASMTPGGPTPMEDVTKSPVSDDASRGRRRTRGEGDAADGETDYNGDADAAGAAGSSRKRRRSRKGLDKKFECPHEGCGKSYSRAEHLYRHQLNHNPKQIYHCDFPDCNRSFVRQDLCARHKERHTARGSQLLRKDTFMNNLNPIVTGALANKNAVLGKPPQGSPPVRPGDGQYQTTILNSNGIGGKPSDRSFIVQSPASAVPSSATAGSEISPPLDAQLHSPAAMHAVNRSKSDDMYRAADAPRPYEMNTPRSGPSYGPGGPQRHTSFGSMGAHRPQISPHTRPTDNFSRPPLPSQQSVPGSVQSNPMHSPYGVTPTQQPQQYGTPQQQASGSGHFPSPSPATYQSQQNFPQFTSLPPPTFTTMSQAPTSRDDSQYATSGTPRAMQGIQDVSSGANDNRMSGVTDAFEPSLQQQPYTMPVFGGDGLGRSPFAMADDFTAWLFNDSQFNNSPMGGYPGAGNMSNMMGSASIGLQAPYFNYDGAVAGYLPQPAPPQHPMAVNAILDTSLPESALSESKRQEIIDLITMRFNETDHAPVRKQKEELLEGDKDNETHVLSLHMMQVYIGSYWLHFHPQLPILHRPTFNADACPDLLLICMMALGASCLEKNHGHEVTNACSELASFLAWHVRWEIFMDADFRPPAKLWIFQALLLLEIFEKMYSTRPLHERAHIHHATTLTLMRRGSSLIGRSALDSPPSVNKDAKQGSVSSSNGSAHASGTNTPDEWWHHWITNEATRRAAFAAFVMDSIHATMFGHSAVMVAHEMRLPLPCDEALWSATSSAEVGRVEASLHANGVKPTTFLDGLKKTLNGQPVRTNSFGRTILMAGLLSVSWHMNQRDLQVSSLGVSQALGGRDKWRGSLTRAFDFWKRDFDESLAKSNDLAAPGAYSYSNAMDDDNVFESRTVLHHLAHMAMHVDIVDCQIFAGAPRLLGRSITNQDYQGAKRRMQENWAPTARARDATFYALRFLGAVLLPEDHHHHHGGVQAGSPPSALSLDYSARDDFLLNRPWVLYFATLIVWSYGFALDGPIRRPYGLASDEARLRDMGDFLRRVGGVRAPDDLAKTAERNRCLGLLMLMRDMFRKTRWELLHEASTLLNKCVEMLAPGQGQSGG